jgi:hypothetical protein
MKLKLMRAGRAFDGILFGTCEPLPQTIEAVYRLDVNEYNGLQSLQLTLHHWRAPSTPCTLSRCCCKRPCAHRYNLSFRKAMEAEHINLIAKRPEDVDTRAAELR